MRFLGKRVQIIGSASRKPLCHRAESATQIVLGLPAMVFVGIALTAFSAAAAQLEVLVKDSGGAPLREVVVTVSDGHAATTSATERSMVMDQLNMRFAPEVLVVPVGGNVLFPNSDSVSHQVYSFSAAKRFQLPLYKGSQHPPVLFDKPGLVVVGCNIHDHMVGYIYVTDAHWYGETDTSGKVMFVDVPAGKVTLTIWHPRIADAVNTLSRAVDVAANGNQSVEFRLNKNLRAQPEPRPRNPDWDY